MSGVPKSAASRVAVPQEDRTRSECGHGLVAVLGEDMYSRLAAGQSPVEVVPVRCSRPGQERTGRPESVRAGRDGLREDGQMVPDLGGRLPGRKSDQLLRSGIEAVCRTRNSSRLRRGLDLVEEGMADEDGRDARVPRRSFLRTGR